MGWFVKGWRESAGWLNRRIERKATLQKCDPSYLGTRLAGLPFEISTAAILLPPLFVMATKGSIGTIAYFPLVLIAPLIFVGSVRSVLKMRRRRIPLEEFASVYEPGIADLDRVSAARAAIAASFGMEPELLHPLDDAISLRWFLERPTALEISTRFAQLTGAIVNQDVAIKLTGERKKVAAAVLDLIEDSAAG